MLERLRSKRFFGRTSSLLKILTLVACAFVLGCSGSHNAGPPQTPLETVRFIPTEAKRCLRIPKPKHPKLIQCPPDPAPCPNEALNVELLLAYLDKLDGWAEYAEAACGPVESKLPAIVPKAKP